MIDSKTIDELAQKLTASLPPGVREFHDEVEKNIRASLQAGFSRLDLVTREEFDAQAKVLARTRAQLEELNRRVAELEQGAGGTTDSGTGASAHSGHHGGGSGPTGTV
ncbi:ubiquinone biosynthesis accessory factor UbiK [Halorhodospira neutriphila]|uniref:ubiquinone biosynthesis accessory factor UbiK n=1 Tax=Halorhodospira neutriphila TaxID=168379 RepID=UPI001F5B469C|nr:accessory factor UbiK family protein [Halorhodospira neutriphila]